MNPRWMRPSHLHFFFKLVREAIVTFSSLAGGTVAAGFLYRENDVVKAAFLTVIAVAGGAGTVFFFFRMLRLFSPKRRRPFIATLP